MKYHHILLRDFRTEKDGQVVNYNIGTAAHAPGTIAALRKYLPADLKITIWADAPLSPELARMMKHRFPDVAVLTGGAEQPQIRELFDSADLFLVSSGSGIASSVADTLLLFQEQTRKPAAAYAIGYSSGRKELIRSMDFCFFRDSLACGKAEHDDALPRISGFAPDAVFEFDASDDQQAELFLQKHDLVQGKFICCIPGQRYTPRWEYFSTPAVLEKIRVNAEKEEHDNAPLRTIIEHAVTGFGLKAVICPEQIPELDLCRRLIYDKLPPEIRKHCVLVDRMWSPGLALAVYRKSSCVCGMEMHSQVMAAGNGIPAVIFHHSGFGTKYAMWNDVGLGEWAVDADRDDYSEKAEETVLNILQDPQTANEKLNAALDHIHRSAKNALTQAFM